MKLCNVRLHLTILMLVLTAAPATAQLRTPAGDRPPPEFSISAVADRLDLANASASRQAGISIGLALPLDSVAAIRFEAHAGSASWVGAGYQVRSPGGAGSPLRAHIGGSIGYVQAPLAPDPDRSCPPSPLTRELPSVGQCERSIPKAGFGYGLRAGLDIATGRGVRLGPEIQVMRAPGPSMWLVTGGLALHVELP